jgi:hypothetical protein
LARMKAMSSMARRNLPHEGAHFNPDLQRRR